MRYARGDEEEIAGAADHAVLQLIAVARLDRALDEVDRGFESDVRVRLGCRGRRDLDQVHADAGGTRGLVRDADEGGQTPGDEPSLADLVLVCLRYALLGS
jgi:hypothetical protein